MGTLDSAVARFPTDGPVVIVTASYEGQPADNAAHFVEWLTSLSGNECANASYAVFGCGSHEWPRTYQRIPILIDDTLKARGARRLLERGEGDSSAANFFEAFDEFEDKLWATLSKVLPSRSNFPWLLAEGDM
jgi:cytochrome P450 / NADPH-cytochrome P450 reductase